MKVVTLVGTRPELIKLSQVIKKLDLLCDHTLIHTGQNYDYELNEVFFKDLEIRKPDYFLEAVGENLGHTIGNIISKSFDILEKIKPDAFLIYGDTNSCLGALSAKRLKIPIFHMEAGNRCFDLRVPEEINRKIVDHISDINMTISENARDYLISEGLEANKVIKVGSSMLEVLEIQKEKIERSNILEDLKVKNKEYFAVSLHREENVDSKEKIELILDTLNKVVETYQKKIVFSLHPRTRKRVQDFGLAHKLGDNFIILKPLGFNDYIKLQTNAYCTISDSGTISEESSLLRFPAITIREAHERPEAMEEGTIIMTGLNEKNIIDSINVVTSLNEFEVTRDYNTKFLSSKIIKIIFSYTKYINTFVWKK